MSETVTVKYKDRDVTAKQIADGVFQRAGRKGATTYLIRCSVTGEMCYCSVDRLDKLIARHGSVEAVGTKYISREGKREVANKVEQVVEADHAPVDEPVAEAIEILDHDPVDDVVIHDADLDDDINSEIMAELDALDLDELNV